MYGIGKRQRYTEDEKLEAPIEILRQNTCADESCKATNFIAACYGVRNVPNMSAARYNIRTSKMANKN